MTLVFWLQELKHQFDRILWKISYPHPTSRSCLKAWNPSGSQFHLVRMLAGRFRCLLRGLKLIISVSVQHYPPYYLRIFELIENYYLNIGIYKFKLLKYSHISLDIPLEHQGVFHAVVWKIINLLKVSDLCIKLKLLKIMMLFWPTNKSTSRIFLLLINDI